jgi:hypothetical protein
MVLIFAEDRRQAEWLANWLGFKKDEWAPIIDFRTLGSIQPLKVIRWGTFFKRDDYGLIMNTLDLLRADVLDISDDYMRAWRAKSETQ